MRPSEKWKCRYHVQQLLAVPRWWQQSVKPSARALLNAGLCVPAWSPCGVSPAIIHFMDIYWVLPLCFVCFRERALQILTVSGGHTQVSCGIVSTCWRFDEICGCTEESELHQTSFERKFLEEMVLVDVLRLLHWVITGSLWRVLSSKRWHAPIQMLLREHLAV